MGNIFFSTEFIFSGNKGNYGEGDLAKTNQLYGNQKYLIEKYITKRTKNFSILRIAKTYGDKLNDNTLISNFILVNATLLFIHKITIPQKVRNKNSY